MEKKTEQQFEPAKVFSIKHKRHDCDHKKVTLDLESRQVICDSCERQIDPFDFLYSNAVEESTALNTFMRLLQEKKKLQSDIEKIKKQKVFLNQNPSTNAK